MKFERVRQCETGEYSPMTIEEFTIYQPEKKQYKINATINILEDIDSKSNIIVGICFSAIEQKKKPDSFTK